MVCFVPARQQAQQYTPAAGSGEAELGDCEALLLSELGNHAPHMLLYMQRSSPQNTYLQQALEKLQGAKLGREAAMLWKAACRPVYIPATHAIRLEWRQVAVALLLALLAWLCIWQACKPLYGCHNLNKSL